MEHQFVNKSWKKLSEANDNLTELTKNVETAAIKPLIRHTTSFKLQTMYALNVFAFQVWNQLLNWIKDSWYSMLMAG